MSLQIQLIAIITAIVTVQCSQLPIHPPEATFKPFNFPPPQMIPLPEIITPVPSPFPSSPFPQPVKPIQPFPRPLTPPQIISPLYPPLQPFPHIEVEPIAPYPRPYLPEIVAPIIPPQTVVPLPFPQPYLPEIITPLPYGPLPPFVIPPPLPVVINEPYIAPGPLIAPLPPLVAPFPIVPEIPLPCANPLPVAPCCGRCHHLRKIPISPPMI